jgi:hypothetical protein
MLLLSLLSRQHGNHVHQIRKAFLASSLAIAAMAICGCEEPKQVQSGERMASLDTPVAITQSATQTGAALQSETAKGQGVKAQSLQAELAAVQSQQAALQVERDRIARLLESHQAVGDEKLVALKKQWSAISVSASSAQAATREQFAERARIEMESALMMDQEYRAQLQETDDKLHHMQQRMRELNERVAQ